MLGAMPLSRPKPPQAGAKASLYKGIDPGDNCHQRSVATPGRRLNPGPSGQIDCLGVGNSPTEIQKAIIELNRFVAGSYQVVPLLDGR